MKPNCFFFLIILSLLSNLIWAQKTILTGTVLEKGSQEPVAFAHAFFKNTTTGATTDFDGKFELEVEKIPSDTLIVQCLGFATQRIFVGEKRSFQIALESNSITIQEVEVVAGENPAFAILDSIIARKPQNNPEAWETYTCHEYAKTRFDLNNFTEKTKQSFLLRPFDYIWDNTDTTAEGVPFLPVLLVEKSIKHFYQNTPQKQRSVVEAKNVSGLPGPKLLQFVEDLYFTPNIYNDFVPILEKNFVSPLHPAYNLHYWYLLDSTGTGNDKNYIINFRPKNKRGFVFTGHLSVNAKTFALRDVSLRFDVMANVNFVRSYLVEMRYDKLPNGKTAIKNVNILGDFTVVENATELTGFFGRKKSFFTHYIINQPIDEDSLRGTAIVVEAEDAEEKTEAFWEKRRPDSLTVEEQGVKQMVADLENDPKFIWRKNVAVGIATGYVPFKHFDIGDFYTFYSYNYVEHSRVKFGFRTREKNDWPVGGNIYGAYGFYDQRWKYGLNLRYAFGEKKHTQIGAGAQDDIYQLGRSFNALAIDHIFTSLVTIGDVSSRIYFNRQYGFVQQKIATGLVARVGLQRLEISPTDTLHFYSQPEPGIEIVDQNYLAIGPEFNLNFSWQNHELDGDFYSKAHIKKAFRKWPDLRFHFQMSSPELGASVDFKKLKIAASQFLHVRSLGYFQYYIEAGKTFGVAPYPFLDIPFGNQIVFNDDFAFNLLKYMEFVSDQYVMVNAQHHFDGFILDKVPLVNALKFRSFVFAKGYFSSLSDENLNSKYVLPDYIKATNGPYYEVGFGLENIFKIARMDFVWRLNNPAFPAKYTFIIKPSFSFQF